MVAGDDVDFYASHVFAKIGIKALQGTLESRKLLLEVPTPEQQLALRFDAYVFFS